MFRKTNVWREFSLVCALFLTFSMLAVNILETYRTPVDVFFGTRNQQTMTESSEDGEDVWMYQSKLQTVEEAYEGLKELAIRASQETYTLLKDKNGVLPLSSTAKITMLGVRSYASVYGNNDGSVSDGKSTVEIFNVFSERGSEINPSMLETYQNFFKDEQWIMPQFGGGILPNYAGIDAYDNPHELTFGELTAPNPDCNKDYASYNDVTIVVVGHIGGEGGDGYHPGEAGWTDGVETVTDSILSLSDEEMAATGEAKANSDKVIVLINATNQMETANLEGNPDIGAILWIGYPGAYGFYGVADVLNGTVSLLAYLGDTSAKNSALALAMQNYGNIPWENAGSLFEAANVNSYLIEAEGTYTGYRYYETRYVDIVLGNGGEKAFAGTYASPDGTVAEVDGTWDYTDEVAYPFGYGSSYTTFEQTLDSVEISGDKKTAAVSATMENTGDYAGKAVMQVYAQAPYMDHGKQYHIEKSAVQLLDFEKTNLLQPDESQTITMETDTADLASYDLEHMGTYVVTLGDYYLTVGEGSRDTLNNILAAQGKTTEDGMTEEDDAGKSWQQTWGDDVDTVTFVTSKAGVEIINALSDGDHVTDINSSMPDTVTYFSRSDWDGTFPKIYSGLAANEALSRLLGNDFIELKTGGDTSDIILGDTSSDLTINDLKGVDSDDPRWEELLNKVMIDEFLNFAVNAFYNIVPIESVGLLQYVADDGPNGSDSHYLTKGSYQGTAYGDAAEYDYGTRVGPTFQNIAYSWNKELAYENGEIVLGESTLVPNLPIMTGLGMNTHHHAYNSRGARYCLEGPIPTGYIGSAVVQGAQSKGMLVSIKHVAFNDQEINRSGIAVSMSEQEARELKLRGLQQAFEVNGKPASFRENDDRAETYIQGVLGVTSSYNRIDAVAPSINRDVQVQIMREEQDSNSYNVTDFTGMSLEAAPKESILAGTTAFCGFGVSEEIGYWNGAAPSDDRDMALVIRENTHYVLYVLTNSAAMNDINATIHTVDVMTWWRTLYMGCTGISAALAALSAIFYAVSRRRKTAERSK